MGKDAKDFASKLESIQTIKTVNDLINFRKANPEKIDILKYPEKKFFKEYFADNGTGPKELLKEAMKEDTIF